MAGGKEPKYLGPILNFLVQDAVRSALLDWSEDSPAAALLESFSKEVLRFSSELSAIFVPRPDKKVGQVFQGVGDFYLPVLLASRSLPVLSDDQRQGVLRASLDRLRVMCLVQAVSAVQAGFAKERNLSQACQSIRIALESLDRDRLALFEKVALAEHLPYSLMLDKLTRDLERARVELGDAITQIQQRTVSALRRVACGEWAELPAEPNSGFQINPDFLEQLQNQRGIERIPSNIGLLDLSGEDGATLDPGGHPNSPTHGHLKLPHLS
ncbi:MAG: hypothetical protein KGN37_16110 [Burkholderiales bacterium]|nr:hypothetical protein [Burkholderiales bacterium]